MVSREILSFSWELENHTKFFSGRGDQLLEGWGLGCWGGQDGWKDCLLIQWEESSGPAGACMSYEEKSTLDVHSVVVRIGVLCDVQSESSRNRPREAK